MHELFLRIAHGQTQAARNDDRSGLDQDISQLSVVFESMIQYAFGRSRMRSVVGDHPLKHGQSIP